ncbi:MAG TPA: hypothetical protein VGF49_19085 [Candidatus Solibacter sp.]
MNPLTRELLLWVSARPRTYVETMEAWRSNCPRQSTWEDACIEGLVEVVDGDVRLTAAGSTAVRNFTGYSVSG